MVKLNSIAMKFRQQCFINTYYDVYNSSIISVSEDIWQGLSSYGVIIITSMFIVAGINETYLLLKWYC